MGVGVGDITRGVEGTWYCCDMVRMEAKEWNGGKAGSRSIVARQYRSAGYILYRGEWRVEFW